MKYWIKVMLLFIVITLLLKFIPNLNGNYIEIGYKDLDQMTETYLDINVIYSKKIEEENE